MAACWQSSRSSGETNTRFSLSDLKSCLTVTSARHDNVYFQSAFLCFLLSASLYPSLSHTQKLMTS